MRHEFAVENGVRPKATRTVMVGQWWGRCYNRGVEVRTFVEGFNAPIQVGTTGNPMSESDEKRKS
jgi:hypothetical protein